MATSTFNRNFVVRPEMAERFTKEIIRLAAPTLNKNFHSNLTHEKDLRKYLKLSLQ